LTLERSTVSKRRRFITAAVVTGVALVAPVAATSAAAAAPARSGTAAGAALAFNVNGPWTDNGSAKPVITAVSNVLVIDMSYAHRPTATGTVIDASSILVTFPDTGAVIGTFVAPTVLQWSNGSVWQKVYTAPMVIDLNDNWTDGLSSHHITQVNGFITVNMSADHRPNATGFAVGPARFLVSFPDDRNTGSATLQAPDVITWSNGSQWRPVPPPPPNPQCLQARILC